MSGLKNKIKVSLAIALSGAIMLGAMTGCKDNPDYKYMVLKEDKTYVLHSIKSSSEIDGEFKFKTVCGYSNYEKDLPEGWSIVSNSFLINKKKDIFLFFFTYTLYENKIELNKKAVECEDCFEK